MSYARKTIEQCVGNAHTVVSLRMKDIHDLALTTESPEAAEAFNGALFSYLGYRVDAADRLKAALEADPGFALAHCLRGCLAMLLYKAAAVPMAE